MGQYYRLLNLSKEEYIEPRRLGSGAKLWEICANDLPRVLPYLFHQSSGHGGGDPHKQPTDHLGRWAGDRLVVVGDYDDSDLYERAGERFDEISDDIRPELNIFLPPPQQLDESIYGRHVPEDSLSE